MMRRTCHATLALWWLVLVLLPLRGWAGVAMHLDRAAGSTAAAAASCHGADDDAAASSHDGSACTLCGLCHGGVAALGPAGVPLGDGVGSAAPRSAAAPAPQADSAGVYRPPRR